MSVAVLVVGAGVATGLLLQGGDEAEEPVSKDPPATFTPEPPPPVATPSSPEPSKTKEPPKPAPSTAQPSSSTPSARPTPTQPPASVPDPFRDAERALEFADEVREQWWGPRSGDYGSDGYSENGYSENGYSENGYSESGYSEYYGSGDGSRGY